MGLPRAPLRPTETVGKVPHGCLARQHAQVEHEQRTLPPAYILATPASLAFPHNTAV